MKSVTVESEKRKIPLQPHFLAVYWPGLIPEGKKGYILNGDRLSNFFDGLKKKQNLMDSKRLGYVPERSSVVYLFRGRALHVTDTDLIIREPRVPVAILDVPDISHLNVAAELFGLPIPRDQSQLYRYGPKTIARELEDLWEHS